MTKKHEELVEELDNACRVTMTVEEFWQRAITLILSAVRDGKVEILCPECNEPIKVLKCEGCHLENVDGYIRH